MNENMIKILLVEDDTVDQMAFAILVRRKSLPYEYLIVNSIEGAYKMLKTESFDVVIMDYVLGDEAVFDLFDALPDISIIITTGSGNEEIAVKAMKAGAYAYLNKDPAGKYLDTLPLMIERALQRKREASISLQKSRREAL